MAFFGRFAMRARPHMRKVGREFLKEGAQDIMNDTFFDGKAKTPGPRNMHEGFGTLLWKMSKGLTQHKLKTSGMTSKPSALNRRLLNMEHQHVMSGGSSTVNE